MKIKHSMIILLTLLLLVGCGQKPTDTVADPNNGEPKEEVRDRTEEVIPPAATDPDEIFMQNPGSLMEGEVDFNQAELRKKLEEMPEGLSNEEILDHLVYYLAQDYQSVYQELQAFDPTNQPNVETPDGEIKRPELEQVNVFVLLDASGSMAAQVPGGVMMDLAKKAIHNFTRDLPEDAHASLYAYGHKGSNQAKDKKISCESIEEVYELSSYNESRFNQALDQIGPTGWTPLAAAIEETTKAVKETDENTRNIVYVVSDGEETCGGDPVQAAKELSETGAQTVINILGFNVDKQTQKQLLEMAKASNGSYKDVLSGSDLDSYLKAEQRRIEREWDMWRIKSTQEVDASWASNTQRMNKLVYRLNPPYGLLGLVKEERKRLLQAADTLNEMGKVEDIIDLRSIIHKRGDKLENRALNFERTISKRLEEERSKAKLDIEEKSNEKKDN
ncbi:vWA domain-containing protein [Desmospora profundinema]|uniref:D-amino-acid dehydrogenase/Ca-activated chloride channel family protein n=1 Tax=Desmospora profundinema TaxID=1571184 RepID=A0ABU1IQI9_9BACL|nr:VWA domain-containing protein [Desmospora profundinema]MDR6227067.1 D-amino-acid dehydrogenase/Ca-activated chloride channel family protein [Desmospora profundinema]